MIDFLEAELSAAQARIAQLDASVKDKENRVAILMARIKILEDERTKQLYENYFPEKSNNTTTHTNPSFSQAQPSVGHGCTACYPCCHNKSQMCVYSKPCCTHGSPTANEDLVSAITALQAQVQEILEKFVSKQSESIPISDPNMVKVVPPQPPQKSPHHSNTEVSMVLPSTADLNLDSSTTSIEEFMQCDNLLDQQPNRLNLNPPTTQQ